MSAAVLSPGLLLRQRMSGFLASLRDSGYAVGLAEARDGLRLLAGPTARSATTLRPALRALFCGRLSDWQKFDEIFDAFWLGRGVRQIIRAGGANPPGPARLDRLAQSRAGAPGEPAIVGRGLSEPDDTLADGRGRREGASRAESLARTDLRHLADPAEIAAAHALAERLAQALRRRLLRHSRPARHGGQLDLRRTIRRSIGRGGTPIELVFRRRKVKALRLVLLLDASGSMSLYAPFFIRFMHGVLDAFREAEGFVFHTRLLHVSPALAERRAARALDRLSLIAQGMGGGTQIGECLGAFNRWHAKRVLHSRTAVMIFSDGYETGAPEILAREMRALRRRCRHIAWLNPMLGSPNYAPSARGMAAALPFIDLFAPAHDLASLARLESYLARL